jgi:hypothetical protein
MTELEAYEKLGWAPEGGAPSPFVLPAGDDLKRTDWCVTFCAPCGWSGISVPQILDQGCPGCGAPWTKVR